MKIRSPKEAFIMLNAAGVGTVTRKLVYDRAVELAYADGRAAHEVSPNDWQQAMQELGCLPEIVPRDAFGEETVSEHWNQPPDSTGHIVTVPSIDDEDEDGRSFSERLIQEGLNEAEHDLRVRASRDSHPDHESL